MPSQGPIKEHGVPGNVHCRAEVITEPEFWSGLRKKSTIFVEAGAGPGFGFLNEKRTRSRSKSENFSFYRSRIIDFIKFKLSLNG